MLRGTGSVDSFLDHAATMAGFDAPTTRLPEAVVVQALFEIRVHGRDRSLPSAGVHAERDEGD